jgi:hypothetical protein
MYTRGQAVDYDSFNTEGWSYKELLPFLKKFETFHPASKDMDTSLHGKAPTYSIFDIADMLFQVLMDQSISPDRSLLKKLKTT